VRVGEKGLGEGGRRSEDGGKELKLEQGKEEIEALGRRTGRGRWVREGMRGGKDGGEGGRGGRTHLGPAALSFSGTARRETLILVFDVVNNVADVALLGRKAWWGGRAQGVCGSRWGSGEAGRIKAWATQRKSGSNRNGARPEQWAACLLVDEVMVCCMCVVV